MSVREFLSAIGDLYFSRLLSGPRNKTSAVTPSADVILLYEYLSAARGQYLPVKIPK